MITSRCLTILNNLSMSTPRWLADYDPSVVLSVLRQFDWSIEFDLRLKMFSGELMDLGAALLGTCQGRTESQAGG